ncbi:MAG: PH domain-containing protein [bacterium]|nr:PH domain-containing protein [bacterium]
MSRKVNRRAARIAKGEAEAKRKSFKDQYEDEDVLFLFRKHPIAMRKGLIIGAFALLVGPLITLGLTYARPLDPPSVPFFFASLGLSFILSILIYIPNWISWHFSYFLVTDQRVIQIIRKGLFHKTVIDMNLNQIQSMNYQVNGFQAHVLGFGTIMIQTYMGDLVIHEIQHPEQVQRKLALILKEQGVEPMTMSPDDE